MPNRLRVLELFCGIGGCAAALGDRAQIVAAVDINQVALSVYRQNFSSPPVHVRTIESLPADGIVTRRPTCGGCRRRVSRTQAAAGSWTSAMIARKRCWP